MTRVDQLQGAYDDLTLERDKLIRAYDQAPDGSVEKHQAVTQLEIISSEIHHVEREISQSWVEGS